MRGVFWKRDGPPVGTGREIIDKKSRRPIDRTASAQEIQRFLMCGRRRNKAVQQRCANGDTMPAQAIRHFVGAL
jgi:hypothetical protein